MALLLPALHFLPVFLTAQSSAPAVGVVEVGLLLRQLDGEKRVLMIGAHPDDEDTSMITALARGYGARTAYLSLTRGEGGQNLIGTELGEGLGLIRTGELMAARSIDGGEQFFTRAFDFGFSKTADEALAEWGLDEVVRDVTWVIRSFRPHVIVAVFTGTPRDGHGHHQAAGIAARRAFEVAGDARVYPDQLLLGVEPWQPSTIYQLVRGNGERTVEIQTGRLDALVGRSFYQIAMDSRSQHRTQDMGAAQTPGPRASGVGPAFAESEGVAPQGEGFFAGIDTTLAGIALAADVADDTRLVEMIADYRAAVAVAGELLHPDRPEQAASALGDAVLQLEGALALAREAPEGPGRAELLNVLERRKLLAGRALLASAGVVVDVRMDRDRLVPGESAEARFIVWNGGSMDVSVEDASLEAPEGWDVRGDDADGAVQPGEVREWTFELTVPASAEPSRLYFLEGPRAGNLYQWPVDAAVMGLPGNPPFLNGVVELNVGDATVTARRAATYVGVDQANGEFRLPLFVVPALSVTVEPALIAWPEESSASKSVALRVANLSGAAVEGDVRLVAPAGWEVAPQGQSFSIASGGETSFAFEVRPGPGAEPGRTSFQGIVRSGGREYGEGVQFIEYPHIEPAALFRPSELAVSYFPVDVAPDLVVGYVMGSGDPGLDALLDLGIQAEALTPETVRSGDLDRFDTVVLGIRAYETREDLQAANERLLDFARRGGTVVVQYQQYQYPEGGYAPLPVEIAQPHDRVTDENAAVAFLDPAHPLLTTPNPLGPADFEGWVQERGLYFLGTWDPAYTPLLEMADPGEEPKRGSLLVTRLGEGAYVYTGLALFRQFAAGVPGAYRILANLVSLRGSDVGSGVIF